mgnify:CR=1 FL=1
MLRKIFWSLSALLSSLIGVWGVVRLGWTWELAFAGTATVAFLAIALATGRRAAWHAAAEEPSVEVDAAVEEPYHQPVRTAADSQRFEWGEAMAGAGSGSGPTEF